MIIKIDVHGQNGYSFAVTGEFDAPEDAIGPAAEAGCFDDAADANYATAEDISDDKLAQKAFKSCTYDLKWNDGKQHAQIQKNFFVAEAENLGISVEKYLEGIEKRYAILVDDEYPLCFEFGVPVIYFDLESARKTRHEGEKVITVRELLERFCAEEYKKYKNLLKK